VAGVKRYRTIDFRFKRHDGQLRRQGMRVRLAIVLAFALCAGCSKPFGNSLSSNAASGSQSGGAAADAAVTVGAAGGNPCAATWNGAVVPLEELSNRSVALFEQAIERAGGIANLQPEQLPRVRLEASPALTFACVGPVIAALQQGGIPEIMLKPTGAVNQPVSVHTSLTSSGAQPANIFIEFAPGGRIAWNGEATDLASVRSRIREFEGDQGPPGRLAVIVAPDATFAAAFALLEAVAGAQPILLPPGSTVPPPAERGLPPPGELIPRNMQR
jgi:hypothetical protein